MYRTMTQTTWMRLLLMVAILYSPCSMFNVLAQIKIGGNVYGGGNQGVVDGNTAVTLYGGDLNKVFGGARMADIGGHALVNIDGENASSYILINQVYGGNDISGTIGTNAGLKLIPSVLSKAVENGITDNTETSKTDWNAFVRISTKTTPTGTSDTDAQKIYIGQLFGGGNGDYDYTSPSSAYYGKSAPNLTKTYLEILGGSIVNMFGGGNSANVTVSTVIHLDNPSEVVNHIYVKDGKEVAEGTTGAVDLLVEERFKKMGFNYKFTYPNSGTFQIGNLFGGNNKVDMAIQPKWNLLSGKVRNLYSGGNEGRMTCPRGLLLQIPENSTLTVDNVYGGCRKADVRPLDANGKDVENNLIQLESNPTGIPAGFAARTRILGGNINNVYGGNDISGNVYGGNTVAILTTVHGNVYGGGNGSYAYTDNTALKNELLWRDFYYDPDEVFTKAGVSPPTDSKLKSAEALNLVRPNAEQVSLLLRGTAEKPVFVEGAIFVGGNSASLREITPTSELADGIRKVEVKIGSYVTADQLFLGNNGENMVKTNKELRDNTDGLIIPEGVLRTIADTEIAGSKFNSMILTDPDVFDKYMEGCAMKVMPRVVFDDVEHYDEYTTHFGSLYCGGNVGSMLTNGLTEISFSDKAIIYNKVVGGCNNADVDADPENKYNAAYKGGLLGAPNDNGDKLKLNFSGLKIQPKRWLRDENNNLVLDSKGNPQLIWNTIKASTGEEVTPTNLTTGTSTAEDLDRRLKGGNIYGGCYTSGHVNGNVIINLDATLMDPDVLFDKVAEDSEGEAVHYGDNVLEQNSYEIQERRTGVILGQQGMDVLGKSLNVFGGGKGKDTEIWGSTTINLNKGYTFQVFGGSEEGVIGKYKVDSDGKPLTTLASDGTYANGVYAFNGKEYEYNENYSCTVNLKGGNAGVSKTSTENHPDMADCEFIYGGGFLGPICGNTIINLGNGRIFNSFAGSCNADILGHTETYIGRNGVNAQGNDIAGFPYVRDYVYGGNDLGGRILGTADFTGRIRHEVEGLTLPGENAAKAVSAYTEYTQGRTLGIFGGCYGTYDYSDPEYRDFFTDSGVAKTGYYTKPRMDNAFVNFRPTVTDALKSNPNNKVTTIYGSGQGYPGDSDRDIMQNSSYILIDIPQEMTNYSAMEVFGAGAWSGLGMGQYVAPKATPTATEKAALDKVSAIIDLPRGQINAAYGGSYEEGFTRRTVLNVPEKSTIKLNKLFGGAYGLDNKTVCDAYETNVNWSSSEALVGSVYGGNNNARRTLYGRVNINAPVWTNKSTDYMASVFGAGCGENTWSQYTEVNLNKGSQVYIVYGGGQNGRVCNVATAKRMSEEEFNDPEYAGLKIADKYADDKEYKDDGLNNPLAKPRHDGKKYNTNVIINRGAIVGAYASGTTPGFEVKGGYAYGGGMGSADKNRSGDVNGTTYIALLGGLVEKDLVAAGSVGSVFDRYSDLTDDFGNHFEASANAYIAGGVVRNVYGGGYMGSVGKHKTTTPLMKNGVAVKDEEGNDVMIEVDADISATTEGDIPAQAYVTVGIREDQTPENLKAAMNYVKRENGEEELGSTAEVTKNSLNFFNGIPAIQRNVYGGGEGEEGKGGRGGAIFGRANVIMNNGRIGYDYIAGNFIEKLNDETWTVSDSIGRLKDYGNIFGGGYSDKSNVDETNIKIWGGLIRGSVHGGGEIAAVGRGSTKESGDVNYVREFEGMYKAGKTHVEMYNGHVLRNVFGGGKGYNVLGFGGANDLYTDGYVFGQTEVYIHGGEIGTAESVREGKNYGNVFGGGDLGYVYGRGYSNAKTITDKTANKETGSPGHYYYYYNDYKCKTAYGSYKVGDVIEAGVYDALSATDKAKWEVASVPTLTEDCKVIVSPYLQVRSNTATINGKTKSKYDYFSTDDLNYLPKDKSSWTDLFTGDKLANGDPNPADPDERGILIHNAIFGGGNVSSNSDTHYANATTVFANTTATIYDCYHRDFITVGTEHTGGLYGGGNLSKCDGYRELNITNYGTDYYGLTSRITLEEYRNLSNRERAYFQLEYVCKDGTESKTVGGHTVYGVTIDGEFYENGQRVKEDDFEKLKTKEGFNAANWEQFGFCSIYAGRLLNTIQRADFCGVYGSRMVLQGAKDRVAEVGEDIDYTINRVGELSLNLQRSVISGDTGENAEHGNYFGIYSIVNYLGNLTSDVKFGDPYVDSDGKTVSGKTYYSHKAERPTGNDRNYGTSPNQVALASGVFLELTTEQTELNPNKEKEYGYVTGVIELDLINVKRSTEGGGFVYAKNEHRVPKYFPNKKNVLLSPYNRDPSDNGGLAQDEARTYRQYCYTQADEPTGAEAEGAIVISGDVSHVYQTMVFQTSGNFIHPNDKRIVDDCHPTNNAYEIGPNFSPAHYWYVKGSVYVYKQVVSAYTGSANAYSKNVSLPLTITAASHGQLKLLNVKPNLYAYYFEEGKKIGTNGNDGKAWVNNNADSYELNDVITWWDWNNLSVGERKLFVPETVVNSKPCKIDGTDYAVGGYVMLPTDIATFKAASHTITDVEGNAFEDDHGQALPLNDVIDDLFRTSNNIGNESGYVLTFDMDTPKVWDDYYTKESDATDKILKDAYNALSVDNKKLYIEGPTYSPSATGVYGQRDYTEGDIVTKAVYDKTETGYGKENMEVAYVATEAVSYTYNNKNKTVSAGTAIPYQEWSALSPEKKACFGKASVCINSLKLAEETYLVKGDLYTEDQINSLKTTYTNVDPDDITYAFTDAYICTWTGKYGGQRYEENKNYSAMESWCSLSADDREKFNYNYDALDLFADPDYSVETENGKTTEQAYHAPYSNQVPVEYVAVYNSDVTQTLQFTDGATQSFTKGAEGSTLSREKFETIRNDKRFYTRIETSSSTTEAYIATESFNDKGTPYGKGQVVDAEVYASNPGRVQKIEGLTPNSTIYYCYEEHQEGNKQVGVGERITSSEYADLIDHQQYFVVQGQEPTETTTLYVNRESDFRDLTKEKVITVIYQYTYYENGDNGDIKLTNELHVVNIHLQLESGAPTVGTLKDPPVVLPGSAVGLDRPEVQPGVYEVLINGWELYSDKNDAEHHRNGVEFTNNKTPVYWYQNMDHYIAFYSKTYLGKTYSNYVPVRVANYHDIGDIMERYKDNHLYIDRADVDRPCKIYINDYSSLTGDDPRMGKNGLDELKNLFDLSLLTPAAEDLDDDGLIKTGSFVGHAPLGDHIKGAENLDIILRTDIDGSVPDGSPARTSIAAGTGESDPCFGGNIHGDGHTISGLTSSLFGKLCGNVYNLGVTGSFTSAGVADAGDGFVENCWVKSNATALPDGTSKVNAVFGNPHDPENPNCIQVVNCYYPESNAALYNDNSTARKMPDNAFFNGEVAYNLNGFYLGKRYYDGKGESSGNPYSYLPADADGKLPSNEAGTQYVTSTSYYPADYAYYTPQGTPLKQGVTAQPKLGYVEHRFYDGDFRYAGGTIPETFNIRRQESEDVDDDGNNIVTFATIWPDDYLFFGQTLTYGYVTGSAHQSLPSIINKNGERLQTGEASNRVYRAPAYFRNGKMRMAHFNPSAVFAQTMRDDATKIAQKDMTAIDFTGGNGDVAGGFKNGWVTAAPYNNINGGAFCPPLLDDGGITSFHNVNLTKNLLVYTEAKSATSATSLTAAQKTANVVSTKLHDYAYEEGDAEGDGYVAGKSAYHTVAEWDRSSNYDNMLGHWVQKTGDSYVSALDHFLMDKHDFNAPIGYKFADEKRMWYQRTPDNFVDRTKGWEDISLPFTADIVTTNVKGEITHFYNGSNYVDETTKTKVGHEYWLREFNSGGSASGNVYTAKFNYPTAITSGDDPDTDKTVSNTFLWDYYYSYGTLPEYKQKDANKDTYQTYYSDSRTYNSYARLKSGTPYIIGFPGATYYEFDLSGNFSPANTADWPKVDKDLKKQVITFASKVGAEILVSDKEMADAKQSFAHDGYTFVPSYLNNPEVPTGKHGFLLNNDANSDKSKYLETTESALTTLSAFRPYFEAAPSSARTKGGSETVTRSIIFSNDNAQLKGVNDRDLDSEQTGTLDIYSKRKKIVVESSLNYTAEVRIVNVAGATISTFDIEPGETVETNINSSGVYIVLTTDNRYNKKLAVK